MVHVRFACCFETNSFMCVNIQTSVVNIQVACMVLGDFQIGVVALH